MIVAPAVILKSLLLRYRYVRTPAALRGCFFTATYADMAEAAPFYEYASGCAKREGLGMKEQHETQSRDNDNKISMKWCRRDKKERVLKITVPVVVFRTGEQGTKRVGTIVNDFRTSSNRANRGEF